MKMKKLAILMSLLLIVAFTSAAYADEEATAVTGVYVVVNPNITLSAGPSVNAGTIQTGDITAQVSFRVDANEQEVQFLARVTDLWKGDDSGSEVAPIPVNESYGVIIEATNGNPLAGGSSNVFFNGTATVNSMPALETLPIVIQSSQDGHFSQNVFVTAQWTQNDPEKTIGEYSGFIELQANLGDFL
jgi:hypothetical protein